MNLNHVRTSWVDSTQNKTSRDMSLEFRSIYESWVWVIPGIGINVEKAVGKQFELVEYDQYSMHVTPYCVTSLLWLDRNQQMYQIRSNKYYPKKLGLSPSKMIEWTYCNSMNFETSFFSNGVARGRSCIGAHYNTTFKCTSS